MTTFLCLLFLSGAFAITAPKCPPNPAGVPNGQIYPFYKYSYEMNKNGATGAVFIVPSNPLPSSLWFRATSDASTALTASLNVKLTVDRQGVLNDTNWDSCFLGSGSCEMATDFNIPTSRINITASSVIWLTFFPTCPGCRSTVEFSVETAWVTSAATPTSYPDILLRDNQRTMVFEKSQGSFVNFYADITAPTNFTTDVTYDTTSTTTNSEIVLYFNKDYKVNTTSDTVTTIYPVPGQGLLKGNYLQQVPFIAPTAGKWYIAAYVKTAATGGLPPDFTIKVGFNKVPCAAAFSLSASSFILALIALAMMFVN
jgi:hypothetical protein